MVFMLKSGYYKRVDKAEEKGGNKYYQYEKNIHDWIIYNINIINQRYCEYNIWENQKQLVDTDSGILLLYALRKN